VEIIRAAQPFTADASPAKPHALTVLNDLSNRDKHRMINAVQLVVVGPQPIQFGSNADAGPIGEIRMAGGPVQRNGEEFARAHVEPVGPEPLVTILEGRLQGEIIFVEWGLPMGRTLAALARQVARILDQFEPMRP
jgi:hypothetical protein